MGTENKYWRDSSLGTSREIDVEGWPNACVRSRDRRAHRLCSRCAGEREPLAQGRAAPLPRLPMHHARSAAGLARAGDAGRGHLPRRPGRDDRRRGGRARARLAHDRRQRHGRRPHADRGLAPPGARGQSRPDELRRLRRTSRRRFFTRPPLRRPAYPGSPPASASRRYGSGPLRSGLRSRYGWLDAARSSIPRQGDSFVRARSSPRKRSATDFARIMREHSIRSTRSTRSRSSAPTTGPS